MQRYGIKLNIQQQLRNFSVFLISFLRHGNYSTETWSSHRRIRMNDGMVRKPLVK